jgi:hypothetical protein
MGEESKRSRSFAIKKEFRALTLAERKTMRKRVESIIVSGTIGSMGRSATSRGMSLKPDSVLTYSPHMSSMQSPNDTTSFKVCRPPAVQRFLMVKIRGLMRSGRARISCMLMPSK